MSYYFTIQTKEIILRKDTPKEVIDFINTLVNTKIYNIPTPDHKLFTLERWDTLFMSNYWVKEKTYFKNENGQWKLFVGCQINHGREEIYEFADWITPYVTGHKPKEFIGTIKGEDRSDRDNVYIERSQNVKSKIIKT